MAALFCVRVYGLLKMKDNNQLFNLLITSYERKSVIPFTIFDRAMLRMILNEFCSTSKNVVNISSLAMKKYFKKNGIDNYSYEDVRESLSKIISISIIGKHQDYYEFIQYFPHIVLFDDLSIEIEKFLNDK